MSTSYSATETIAFGRKLADSLVPGDIVAFHGDLGAGKTTLIKGIIHALVGSEEREIQSPTFTYMNPYDGKVPVFHFDLYRLKKEADFLKLGFLDFFEQEGICLIEWASRIPSILPKNTLHVTLTTEEATIRRIDVQNR